MSRLLSIFFCIFLTITIHGCTHGTEPIHTERKDPQTYSWTLDTLSFEISPGGFQQVIMLDLWGLNDTLVYTVGYDANYYSPMWKFNGKQWERIHINIHDGGTISKSIQYYGIRGFAPNDLYAFGQYWSNFTGEFLPFTVGLHYDGIQWREIAMPPGQGISSVVAESPSNIYCGGWYDGQIYHFDGNQWSVDTIKATPHPDLYINVKLMGFTSSHELYFQTEQFKNTVDGYWYRQIVKYAPKQSIVMDSTYDDPPWGGRSSWQSKEGTMYSCGTGGIFRREERKWTSFLSTNVILSMFGSSDDHIFAVGMSSIYFYDGTSWRIISAYTGTTMEVHIWCSETQVFIVYSDGAKSYVLHGQ